MDKKLSNDVFYDIKDFDVNEEINLEDIEDIEAFFNTKDAVEPPENLFDDIVSAVNAKYEEGNTKEQVCFNKNIFEDIKNLLFNVRYQVSLLDTRFWIISIIMLFLGYIAIKTDQNFNVVMLSPITSLFSIYYLYRGRYYKVFEMEIVCKYSLYEITLARTIIILLYNIGFVSIMAIINYIIWNQNILILLIMSWLSPLLLSYCTSLYLFYKKGVIYSIISNITMWFMYALFSSIFLNINNTQQINILELNNNITWIGINLFLILTSTIVLLSLFKSLKRIYR